MSSVFEPVVSGNFVVKNGKSNGNGNGTALRKAHHPLGLNAEKVISKRYSLKDEIGEPLESWADIVRRVVGFVSTAEKDPMMRDYFYSSMLRRDAQSSICSEYAVSSKCRKTVTDSSPRVLFSMFPIRSTALWNTLQRSRQFIKPAAERE